ncbi:MAG: outer membrane beta-barrel protein [Pseudomonadota bacterium]
MTSLALLALLVPVGTAQASGLSTGVYYTNVSVDGGDALSLGAGTVALGYSFDFGGDLSLVPEVRFGVGLQDDSITILGNEITTEISDMTAVSLRVEWDSNVGVYYFAQPTWLDTGLDVTSTTFGTLSASTSEVGFGIGAGLELSQGWSVELGYEAIDGTDFISIGLRLRP